MIQEREYLVKTLKDAGIKSAVYTSLKKLKTALEPHIGAVLPVKETVSRSGSKRKFDQEGQRKQRNTIFDRYTTLLVVMADTDMDKVDVILTAFLKLVGKGLDVDRNWVSLQIGDLDWVDEDDSILKAKIAVQFEVTFSSRIYEDIDIVSVQVGQITGTGQGE